MSDQKTPLLVWLDLEMSGLDPESCKILEIATIVTDGDLNIVAEGPDIVVHQEESVLAAMDEWCTRHHAESGLSDQVRNSSISLDEAGRCTIDFLKQHCSSGQSPLCGNTIGQDRRFLTKYLPQLEDFLHYRSIDVSSIKELARRWYPNLPPFGKANTHRALDDIRESINELRYYRERLFVPTDES